MYASDSNSGSSSLIIIRIRRNTGRDFEESVLATKKAAASGMDDIFGSVGCKDSTVAKPRNNEVAISRAAILNLLADGPVKIDMVTWARLLEQNQCLPTDFQAAIKDLTKDGIIANLDADINRRRTHVLVPKNDERWIKN